VRVRRWIDDARILEPSGFDQRSTEASGQVRSLAKALRRSGDELGGHGDGGAARLAGLAAQRLERLGGYVEQKSGEDILRDVEGFARRRPWMLVGLGMLVGAAAARFMKASSAQRYVTTAAGHASSGRPMAGGEHSPTP
jgi:hypothetical protein